MRRQERGPNGQPRGAAEPARHFQHPDLGIAVQSVPGLDLDRGGSLLGHRLQPAERASVELFRGGRPGGAHRGHDPAAGGRQLFVARASEPRLELGAPISPEDEMGVAIDQRRGEPASLERSGLRRLVRRKVRTRPDPGDLPVPDRERPVLDRAVRVRRTGPHRRDARVGQQQVRGAHGLRWRAVRQYRGRATCGHSGLGDGVPAGTNPHDGVLLHTPTGTKAARRPARGAGTHRAMRGRETVRRARQQGRSVINAGFALPRDADRRSAFQAVPAALFPRRCAISRAWRRAMPV